MSVMFGSSPAAAIPGCCFWGRLAQPGGAGVLCQVPEPPSPYPWCCPTAVPLLVTRSRGGSLQVKAEVAERLRAPHNSQTAAAAPTSQVLPQAMGAVRQQGQPMGTQGQLQLHCVAPAVGAPGDALWFKGQSPAGGAETFLLT